MDKSLKVGKTLIQTIIKEKGAIQKRFEDRKLLILTLLVKSK